MVILMSVFLNAKVFCVAYGIRAGINFIHQVHVIYFSTAPSIDAWSMA